MNGSAVLSGRRSGTALLVSTVLAFVGAAAGAVHADEAPPGAASCSGCHPAKAGLETGMPRLAGADAAGMAVAMKDFRNGTRPATVMDRIAKGFSEPEIAAIAAWYGAQR